MNLSVSKSSFIRENLSNILQHYTFDKKEIGKGGFGTVYKGYPKDNPKLTRAIKKIPKQTQKSTPLYTREIQNLKYLDHPGITKLYETFQDKQFVYLVLDLCQGKQLFDRLSQLGNFSQANAQQIFIQMVQTVAYLHKQNISHRDLKAENFLFLQKEGLSVKLIDFGFSYKWKQNMEKQLIATKQNKKLVGSAYYISPQIIGGKYDQRTDIWSLGVLLYILVTGYPPFDGETDFKIFEAIRKGQYDMNLPQLKHVSTECKDLITKMLKPVKQRISFKDIFEHPWLKIKDCKLSNACLKINFKNMKNFTKFNKMKAVVTQCIASQLPDKQIKELGKLFVELDVNHDGFISLQELQMGLKRQNEGVSVEQLNKMIQFINMDHQLGHQGMINYTEFVASLLDKESILSNKQNLRGVFNLFDKDGNGTIQRQQLKQILLSKSNSRKQQKQKQIDAIFKSCDQNGDGKIDFEEFSKVMNSA